MGLIPRPCLLARLSARTSFLTLGQHVGRLRALNLCREQCNWQVEYPYTGYGTHIFGFFGFGSVWQMRFSGYVSLKSYKPVSAT